MNKIFKKIYQMKIKYFKTIKYKWLKVLKRKMMNH